MWNNIIEQNLNLFQCPNCKNSLSYSGDYLLCELCSSKFNIINNCIIDLLSKKPISHNNFKDEFEKRFFKFYYNNFNRPFILEKDGLAWGSPETINGLHIKRKEKLVDLILSQINGKDSLAADVSSGAGWFTLKIAEDYKLVLNIDYEIRNISYVFHKAKELGLTNIIFIRYDMFSPPIAENTLDSIICTDTLIYGDFMIKKFIENILKLLNYEGIGMIDFYNKLHRNPLHKPYLLGYTREEIFSRFLNIENVKIDYLRYYQESLPDIFKTFLPPTRHIIKITKYEKSK